MPNSPGDNIFRPKFLYKNKIKATELYSSSATDPGDPAGVNIQMNAIEANKLVDRNPDVYSRYTQKSGAEINWIPSTPQKINRIILQNKNQNSGSSVFAERLLFSYRDTLGVESFFIDIDIQNSSTGVEPFRNYYFEFPEIEISELRFYQWGGFDNPIGTPYQLGQFIATNEIMEFSANMGHVIKDKPRLIQRLLKLSDGSTSKTFIRKIYNYDMKVLNVRDQDLNNINEVERINRTDSFIFIPNGIEFQRNTFNPAPPTIITNLNEWWDGRAGHYNFKRFELEAFTANYRLNGKSGRLDIEQAAGVR
jgi:hypothetical protein